MPQNADQIHESAAPQLLEQPEADVQFGDLVKAMHAANRGKIRVRVVVQLYRFGVGQRYTNWRGVLWRLDLEPTLTAAGNFRASLGAFFQAITTIGPGRVVDVLQEAMHGRK